MLGRVGLCGSRSCVGVTTTAVSGREVAPDFGHEFVHCRAPVVAGDVVVQVLPDAFDPIVIRAVWRQEVEFELRCQR